jgi:hypothetical protein
MMYHNVVKFVPSATFSNTAFPEWLETESTTRADYKADIILYILVTSNVLRYKCN